MCAKEWFEKNGNTKAEVIDLVESCVGYWPEELKSKAQRAHILIIKGGVDTILSSIGKTADDFFNEQASLELDKKAIMYGRVVDKHARWNLCFGDEDQEADYANGKGTIVSFDRVPCLDYVRLWLSEILSPKEKLVVEGNYYYDSSKCGIGYHGDSERTKVIGVRLGKEMPLCYQWFVENEPVGRGIKINLSHGDIYVMSEKAVGNDWKRKTILTLRHAAGCEKFTDISLLIEKKEKASKHRKEKREIKSKETDDN
jgi:hypothetical protein